MASTIFSFIYDLVDDRRAIAGKFTEAERQHFMLRFCDYKTVGGNTDWHPTYGWGVRIKKWVRYQMEDTMRDTPVSRKIIAGILAEFDEQDELDPLITLILSIARTDFPNGPTINNDEVLDEDED